MKKALLIILFIFNIQCQEISKAYTTTTISLNPAAESNKIISIPNITNSIVLILAQKLTNDTCKVTLNTHKQLTSEKEVANTIIKLLGFSTEALKSRLIVMFPLNHSEFQNFFDSPEEFNPAITQVIRTFDRNPTIIVYPEKSVRDALFAERNAWNIIKPDFQLALTIKKRFFSRKRYVSVSYSSFVDDHKEYKIRL